MIKYMILVWPRVTITSFLLGLVFIVVQELPYLEHFVKTPSFIVMLVVGFAK
jgi:hypothetical protein